MKANEAPEKIWIDPATDLPKLSGHIDKDSVEYIRTDAFIETEIERDKETCKGNGDSLTQESVSNVWHDMSEEAENGRNIIIIDPKNFYGAVLRKGGSQLRNHNKERYAKWAYIDDIINITNKEEIK